MHCLSPSESPLGKIHVPETVANVALGERAHSRLYICGSPSLYAIYLNRRGVSQRILI